jgi:hypothetical protein
MSSESEEEHLVFLTKDEMAALSLLAEAVVNGGGKVQWKLPVSPQWIEDLRSANKKISEVHDGP